MTARVAEGGVSNQTVIFVNNRSAPAQLKICKIAGPGVQELQSFDFAIDGFAPFSTDPATGVAPPGSPGQTRSFVSVLAGPAANGGFCQIVPGTFVVDSLATVTEQAVPNTPFGEVRVSRITSSSGITAPVIRAPGVPFFPLTGGVNTGGVSTRTVTVPITREVAEVEFVNIAFSPVPLKICKVAGTGVAVGTPFTFTVTPDTAGGLLAPFSSTVTVLAGPMATTPGAQNGFCDFVAGPFGGSFGERNNGALLNGLTSFNSMSAVTIQETGFGTTIVPGGGITSPTGSVIANTSNRTALITNMINGVNEVQFVNNAATAPTIKSRKRTRIVDNGL